MHGVTKPITFNISMELNSDGAYALAEIPIVFANWGISNPSVGGFVTTKNSGNLEVLLHLVRGAGNPAASSSSQGSNGGGFGGPVTVPSTTVPPLTVPAQLMAALGEDATGLVGRPGLNGELRDRVEELSLQFFADAEAVDAAEQRAGLPLDALASAGLYGIFAPTSVGGLALGYEGACVVVEELASSCLATTFVWASTSVWWGPCWTRPRRPTSAASCWHPRFGAK